MSVRERERLAALVDRIRESPHNLVSRRAREELWTRHVPEAVALARRLPTGAGRCLDVGSGGGLPGLVVAIVREDLDVELLEATGKKVAFLREAAHGLGLSVKVHHGRAEELARGPLRRSFPLVTARAVAPLPKLVPLTVPFLTQDGVLHAVKGARWAAEVEEADATLRRHGARVIGTPEDLLPGQGSAPSAGPRIVRIGLTE